MSIIDPQVTGLIVSVVMGFLGAPTRIFAQYLRDGTLPDSNFTVMSRAYISAMAGFIYYLITGWGVTDLRIVALGGLMAGYVGVDFVENALGGQRE